MRQYGVARRLLARSTACVKALPSSTRTAPGARSSTTVFPLKISTTKMTDASEAHDWLHGSLARSEASINARLAGGLPFLATVGATSPFIGLFGTVVGIYRALINIGIAGSASIDKVAGPVGEALIMTALGLLVAVPAVLAYNWLQAATSASPSCSAASAPMCWPTSTRRVSVKPAGHRLLRLPSRLHRLRPDQEVSLRSGTRRGDRCASLQEYVGPSRAHRPPRGRPSKGQRASRLLAHRSDRM